MKCQAVKICWFGVSVSCADSESELFSFGCLCGDVLLCAAVSLFLSFSLSLPLNHSHWSSLVHTNNIQFIWQFDLLVTNIIYDLCVLMNNNELQFIYLAERMMCVMCVDGFVYSVEWVLKMIDIYMGRENE